MIDWSNYYPVIYDTTVRIIRGIKSSAVRSIWESVWFVTVSEISRLIAKMQLEMILRMCNVLWAEDNVDRICEADSREEGRNNSGLREISAGVKPPLDYEWKNHMRMTWTPDT